MATQKTTYEEVGLVLEDIVLTYTNDDFKSSDILPLSRKSLKGCHVYFDSWLAKKFPVKGKTNEFVWFVKYEDIVAYEPLS